MARKRRRGLRYIYGHLGADVADAFALPHRLLCVLRRPGTRIHSIYRLFCMDSGNRDMSFGDYLDYSVTDVDHRLEIDNGQIRRLAGDMTYEGLGHEADLLRQALYTAMAPTTILGFFEHLDDLLAQLVLEGYLPEPELASDPDTPDSSDDYETAVARLTDDQRVIFDSYTAWDTYLYDVCSALAPHNAGSETS